MVEGCVRTVATRVRLVFWLLLVGGVLFLLSGWDSARAAGSFEDVSGVHQAGADALDAEGLLVGTECGEARLCPGEGIERWVMAVWLVRAVDGTDPAGSASGRFSDVSPNEWWATHVERLAELEVTLGCGDGTRFCPTDVVTRAQMATFLVRAFELDTEGGAGFTDIAGNTHEGSIYILAAERITAGCSKSPLWYCPNRSVTRGQMATFLARALDLIPRPEPAPRNVQRMVYTGTSENGNQALWVWDTDGANKLLTSLPDGAQFYELRWSPDGTYILYTVQNESSYYHWWVADATGINPPRGLATDETDGSRTRGCWSSDGTRIAYAVRNSHSGYDLWVADADGTNPRKLTDRTRVRSWDWSPDGTRIAFGVDASAHTGGLDELWVADADGTNPRKLHDQVDGRFEWSPDGTQFLYIVGQWILAGTNYVVGELWMADGDGTNPRKLHDQAGGYGWSPDGTHIVYTVGIDDYGLQWWVADADGTNPKKLTDNAFQGTVWWPPDGTRIAYAVETDDRVQAWVADADGTNPRKLTDNAFQGTVWWSPDGTRIAYRVRTGDRLQVWVADADGTNPKKLTDSGYVTSWSPDGTHIVYTVGIDDYGLQVWVADADGTNPKKLTDSGYVTSWSPDGTRITYTVQTDDGDQAWVADADGTNPRKLTDNPWASPLWSPDSTHIAYQLTADVGLPWWVADADGTNHRKLTDRGHSQIWWQGGSQTWWQEGAQCLLSD